MSSVKDLLEQEKDAEELLRSAEKSAEAILKDATDRASEMMRRARSDNALLAELTERNKERIAALKNEILGECMSKAAEVERSCQKNTEAAVKLVVNGVLGVEYER